MAYPPTIPPNNRTNATITEDNHPSDHNETADALTDIVAELDDTIATLTALIAVVTDVGTDDSFRVLAPVDIPYSATNFSTNTQSNARYLAGYLASTGAQNAEVVYRLRGPLATGTWSLRLVHSTNTSQGIYTIATSTDGSSFTDLTTIDGYAGSAVAAVITDATGLSIPAGTTYLRLKMATKNASSSNYFGVFSALTGVRTA